MSVSYAPAKLKVPPGFEHLLEGLTREILRVQPKDIVAFSAEYFREKVVLRDEGVNSIQPETDQERPRDAVAGPGALVEKFDHQESEGSAPHHTDEEKEQVKLDVDVSNPALNKAATVIQSTFRGHLAREKVKDLKVIERSPNAVTAETREVLEGGEEEEKGTDSGTEEEDKSEVAKSHVESESGEVGEGGEGGDGSGNDGENKARGREEGEEMVKDTSGGQVEPRSEDVAIDLPSGEEPVKEGEGGSSFGEQEEQTEEHGPEVEEQEPSLEDSEGDAKASSNIELEGEEKLEPIAASTDETQEMSND